MKWYGSLTNRIEENNQFCDEIKVGTGMTEYMWSDRKAYEVIEVKDQKHVKVRELDHKPAGKPMSNDWELVSNEANPVYTMAKRGKYWYFEVTVTSDLLDSDDWQTKLFLAHNNVDPETLREKGTVKRYHRANVSFGVADYYYDYEF